MLIAVSINKPDLLAELSDTFGRSKYFVIHNSTDNVSEFLPNPFSMELGGAGVQSARFLIEKNIEVLITVNIGLHPLSFFYSLNIKVYHCLKGSAAEAIKLFKEKKLEEIKVNDIELYTKKNRKRFRRNSSNDIIIKHQNKI
jgi:predicted Fe-Mo cluster-binding NifX family protein